KADCQATTEHECSHPTPHVDSLLATHRSSFRDHCTGASPSACTRLFVGQVVTNAWSASRKAYLDVNRSTLQRERCFPERFGQGRMRVAGPGDILAARAEGHRGGRFGDQITGPRPEDVDSKQAIGLLVGEHLDAPLGLAQGSRTAVRGK